MSVEVDIAEYSDPRMAFVALDALETLISDRIGLEKLYRFTIGTLLGIRPCGMASIGDGGTYATPASISSGRAPE